MSLDTSRRRLLAAGGSGLAALFAGCGAVPFIGEGDATIDSADWPMTAHDAQNTNRTTATLSDDPTEQWRSSFENGFSTPVVAGGTVNICSYDGNDSEVGSDSDRSTLHALDAVTGDEQWSKALPEAREFRTRPTVGDGALFYGTTVEQGFHSTDLPEGELHAHEMDGGAERWGRDFTPDTDWLYPTVVGDAVVVSAILDDETGWVRRFDADSGDHGWEEDFEMWVPGPVATDGEIVVVHTNSGNVFGLDFETGERRWTHFDNPPQPRFQPVVPPVLGEERIFVLRYDASDPKATLHALTHDGEEDWHRTVPGHRPVIGSPACTLGLADEAVICLSRDPPVGGNSNTIYLTAFDRASGEERWQYTPTVTAPDKVGYLTLTSESALFAAAGRLHAVSLAGKQRWERPLDRVKWKKPIVADGRLYLDVTGDDEETSTLAAFE